MSIQVLNIPTLQFLYKLYAKTDFSVQLKKEEGKKEII